MFSGWLITKYISTAFYLDAGLTFVLPKLFPYVVFPAAGYITMAIEAVSQLHHETEDVPEVVGFSLRSVGISSTLRIPDDELGIETILNMHRAKLTTSNRSSKWYEFDISSVMPASDNWTEHCSGSISVETTREGGTFPSNKRFL